MIRHIMLIAFLAAASPAARRSAGYAGSTPVGLDGFGAFGTFDCARINTDPRRGRLRTPISDDCPIAIPSPNGRLVVRTKPAPDGGSTLRATGGLVVRDLDQPATLLWKPDSSGFLLNGGEGSGQVSHLRYFHLTKRGWQESRRLGSTASMLYRRRFDCRAGSESYTNTSGWNWTGTGLLRVVVQEGVHSAGCLQPHEHRNVLFEVVGDPIDGRIVSSREVTTLD